MKLEIPGKLEKLKIISLEKGSKQLRPSGGMIVMVNPSSFSESYSWKYTSPESSSTGKPTLKYVNERPKEITIPLFFDGTGAMEPTILPFNIGNQVQTLNDFLPFEANLSAGSIIPVDLQVKLFLKVTGEYDGEQHSTKRLLIIWGKRKDICYLTNVSLSYTLFAPSGAALRAEGTATFTRTEDKILSIAIRRPSSPDLSHQRIVKDGDTLPLLCKEIYGDSNMNQAVARHNGLASFRQLRPGMALEFPPIEQTP